MKMEIFTYVDRQQNVKGYGVIVQEGKERQVLLNTESEDSYFPTEEEARKAGREYSNKKR